MGPFGSNIKAENFTDAGVPVIRGTNLNYYKYVDGEFVYLTEEKADQLKSSYCFPGDLVFTHRGTIGQVGIIPKGKYPKYIISQSGMKVTVNPTLIDNNFLFYFFRSTQGQHELLQHESQVGVPSISNPLTSLKSVALFLPSLPEQQAISSVLSSLDDKIDLLHRQNITLEAMAETLFRQWFLEDAKENGVEKKLGEFFPVITGKKDANYSTEDGLYTFFTCSQSVLKAPGYSFDGHAILLAGNGDFSVKRYIGKFEAYQRTYVLIPYENKYFNLLYILMKYFLAEITGGHQGSVINFITKSMITDYRFSIPNEDITDNLKYFDSIYDKYDQNTVQIRILEKTRDDLLPKLMSGEVRIVK
jgi:type I restriction enzyme S subunit